MKKKELEELVIALEREIERLNTFILRAIQASRDGFIPTHYLEAGLTKKTSPKDPRIEGQIK